MFAKLKNKLSLFFSRSWSFLRPRKKLGIASFVLLSSFVISAWLIFTPVAHAGIIAGVMETFADIFFALAGFFIKLTFFVLKFIIEVAGYNGFIDSSAVIVGWVMVRDVTNMFFIVVLLIISFGTILGLEKYEYKKLLVKLLMAAVIVNFSRLICGLIIDIAQVVMITFVNGIAATASGNLVNMFQVDQIFKLSEGQAAKPGTPGEIFLAGVAALTFATIMLVTMLTFLFLLMARMAMLWVLIVLSPFAFVLNVLPQTEKYASQWWGEFGGHVIAGPIIAFFLWLSFVTVGSGTAHDEIVNNNGLSPEQTTRSGSSEGEQTGLTEIMSWEKMANFAIAIAMLLAGAKMAQQLGVVGGSMMGKAGELGKKVAMYASGLQAARWGAGVAWKGAKGAGKLAGKGLYYGTNLVPGLHGIHPEQWKRRYGDVKNKFWTWRQEKLNRKTTEAGKIAKMFAVNEQGQYVKKVKVAQKDAQGNALLDSEGKQVYKEEEVVQQGAGDWFRRQTARFLLESMPGARGFMQEYSADVQTTREATEKQMEHLASTSSLGMGRKKLEAKQKLKELEETGAGIKAGKEARWEEKRGDILDIIDAGGDYDERLKKEFGMTEGDIIDAESAAKRRKRSYEGGAQSQQTKELISADDKNRQAKAMEKYMRKGAGKGFPTGKEQELQAAKFKAETSQIDAKLAAEKQTEELIAIKELLKEGGKGEKLGISATNAKAMLEQVSFDAEQAKARKLALARDEVLRGQNRFSEANNYDNTLNAQAEERMKKHVGVADYVQSAAKTKAQLERIEKQKDILAKAATAEDKKEAQRVLDVLQKSRLEMQISNVQTHAATGDGIKGNILEAAKMSAEQSMELTAEKILQLQAQDLAELTGETVAAAANESNLEPALQRALQRLEDLYGKKMANSMLELKRRANEKAAGQGSLSRAGLYNVEYDQDGVSHTVLTKVSDQKDDPGLAHVRSRRTSGLSGSKITNVSGFAGSMDRNSKGAAVKSKQSKDILVELASGLTGNNLGSVDKYTKADLASVFENSEMDDLRELLSRLKTEVNDKKALQGLLKFALQESGLSDASRKAEVEKAVADLAGAVQSKGGNTSTSGSGSKNQKRRNRR